MNTKDRILDAAITLFNKQGTSGVSTNHIAESAGISPGNLYYHFSNKEEIIRAIFERLFAIYDVAFALPSNQMPMLDDVQTLVHANFQIMWDYRFIYREIIALLRQDEILHKRYLTIRQRGYEGFHEIINAFTAAGVLIVPQEDGSATRLADLCWLISEFWLPAVEVRGINIDQDQMQQGVALMMQVLQPYIAKI
ncbi:MAG: TetR/AcrR family transcriptional regulator [Chitinophagaceae bacterium]|nr:TetR/AcrR family transcriptional regulator [Anaerolineae bacterium]